MTRITTVSMVVFALVLGLGVPAWAKFLKGPYLQNVTPTSATILVYSDRERIEVEWGETPSLGSSRSLGEHDPSIPGEFRAMDVDQQGLLGSSDADLYELTLKGLRPGQRYHYRVTNAAEGLLGPAETSPVASFVTPTGLDWMPVRFAVLGDCKAKDDIFSGGNFVNQRVTAAVLAFAPDLVLETGDMTGDSDTWGDWQKFFEIRRDLFRGVPFYPVMGNHDNDDQGKTFQLWFSLPREALSGAGNYPPADHGGLSDTELFYSFDREGVHFVGVNTEFPLVEGTDQYSFLARDLAANACRPLVVFQHRPVYSQGKHGDSPDLVATLDPLYRQHGVDLVFQGHDHNYQRLDAAKLGGVTYAVTGGSGATLYDVDHKGQWLVKGYSSHHFITVEYDGTDFKVRAIDDRGGQLDAFTVAPRANDPAECEGTYPDPRPEPLPDAAGDILSVDQGGRSEEVAVPDSGQPDPGPLDLSATEVAVRTDHSGADMPPAGRDGPGGNDDHATDDGTGSTTDLGITLADIQAGDVAGRTRGGGCLVAAGAREPASHLAVVVLVFLMGLLPLGISRYRHGRADSRKG
jgi:hypothetical protein